MKVRWPAEFSGWTIESRSGDLVGSAAARGEPNIVAAAGEHDIRDLEPNTLVEFDLTCSGCSRLQLDAVKHASVSLQAPGRVVEADPRSTMLSRFVNNTLRVIGLAR